MRSTLISFLSLLLIVALTQAVHAQGNSKALGKALRKSGKSLKSTSLGRASKNIARSKALARSTKSLSRSSKSLSRASQPLSTTGRQLGRARHFPSVDGEATRTVGLPHALNQQRHNAQRQLDHRLVEAARLRQLGTDTGNQEFMTQASLIETQAQQHFDDRTARMDEFQTRHSLGPIADPVASDFGPDAPQIDPAAPVSEPTIPIAEPLPVTGELLLDSAEPAQPRILTTPPRAPTRKPTFSERVRGLFPFL